MSGGGRRLAGIRALWVLALLAITPAVVGFLAGGDRGSERRAIDAQAPAKHEKYASQSASRSDSRGAHLRWVNNEHEDAGYEICEARRVAEWAAVLGSPATPEGVAKAFAARNYIPAEREGPYEGCLAALREQLR